MEFLKHITPFISFTPTTPKDTISWLLLGIVSSNKKMICIYKLWFSSSLIIGVEKILLNFFCFFVELHYLFYIFQVRWSDIQTMSKIF